MNKTGNIKWTDAKRGDSAFVKSENKMGVILKDYGRKFHLKFSDDSEKTYDASELDFYRFDEDEYGDGGSLDNHERYKKHGYTLKQVESIDKYLEKLNLIALKGPKYEFSGPATYWVKKVGDEYPIVQFDDGTVYVDNNTMLEIMRITKPSFGSQETSGDKGYNPREVAFGNAVLEWVVKQLNLSDGYLDRRLTGTVIFRPFEPGKAYAKNNIVPNEVKKIEKMNDGGQTTGSKYQQQDLLSQKIFGIEYFNWLDSWEQFHLIQKYKLNENIRTKFKNGGNMGNGGNIYDGVVGQEILFDDSGDENIGVIKEITNRGDYIVNTDDNRTVLAQIDRDVIELRGMRGKPKTEVKKRFGFFEDGGNIEKENNDMLQGQIVEAAHHAKELGYIVKDKTVIEPWVVAKMERATTDLSDVTHYLEGQEDKRLSKPVYATGGNVFTNKPDDFLYSNIAEKWEELQQIRSDIKTFILLSQQVSGEELSYDIANAIVLGIIDASKTIKETEDSELANDIASMFNRAESDLKD